MKKLDKEKVLLVQLEEGPKESNFVELPCERPLDDYSWQELKTIADDLSANGDQSQYYSRMFDLMRSSSTKTFEVSDSIAYEGKMSVRIIGLCQDVKEDGTVAGLTLQATHTLRIARPVRFAAFSVGGWGNTNLRKYLRKTVLPELPKDLKDVIASTRKYYSSTNLYSAQNVVKCSIDKLFLLSLVELIGTYSISQLSSKWEGTGENHGEQYVYYQQKNNGSRDKNQGLTEIKSQSEYARHNITYSYKTWWTRSIDSMPEKSLTPLFYAINEDGAEHFCAPNYLAGVVPAFAL
jgi:hypothetical protein